MNNKLLIILLVLLLIPCIAFASGTEQQTGGTNTNSPSEPVKLTNPINIPADNQAAPIPYLLGKIIAQALGIIGSLALVMFIYGGATWMLSGGNQERVTKGKQILIWATIGMVIIFTAYALVKFVLTAVTG